MAYIDPELMGVFRRRMANPMCFHRVCGFLRSCRAQDLRNPAGAYGVVDGLSRCCGVGISPEQRDNAAHWLMQCGVDPQHPVQRRRMWGLVNGGWF